MTYRYGTATYRIQVDNSAGTGRGPQSIMLDGKPMGDGRLPLRDDAATHEVHVKLG
jgi:cellobiose phosphorylase